MELRENNDFMLYFPDHNLRKSPPREYFWLVVQQLYPAQYNQVLNANRQRLREERLQTRTITVTAEAWEILEAFEPNDLELILKTSLHTLKRPSTLLRETRQRERRVPQQFLPGQNQNQQNPGQNQNANQGNPNAIQPDHPQGQMQNPDQGNDPNQRNINDFFNRQN
jgi:hypothetical protein